MDIDELLKKDVQDFINSNIDFDISYLALKKNPFPTIDYTEILNQITAKKKAKDKLPTWFNTKNIIYPEKISIEQTSSESLAQYKAFLINGNKLIDLTGGFGVDDFYFAQKTKEVIHCELNKELSEIVSHNFKILNQHKITCIVGDSFETLKKLNQKFDWIYIDPSRRNDTKGKVFLLKDCIPNVPELLDSYFSFSNNILIKTAPLLDLTSGLNELKYVKKIHIIALKNEIKELLWEIENEYLGEISISSINIESNDISKFDTLYKKKYPLNVSQPKTFLYEPNSAILKSGNTDAICEIFKLFKLHQHSHLFTSDEKIDFQGRRFLIQEVLPYHKRNIKKIENQKLNCATRNFPLSVNEIKKKHKIKDGGSIFAFFSTNKNNEKIVLLCTKV